MTSAELQDIVIAALTKVAPDVMPAAIQTGVNLREQFDLDSVDFLNFMTRLHEALGIDIPDADSGRLTTIERAVAYLAERMAAAPVTPATPAPGANRSPM